MIFSPGTTNLSAALGFFLDFSIAVLITELEGILLVGAAGVSPEPPSIEAVDTGGPVTDSEAISWSEETGSVKGPPDGPVTDPEAVSWSEETGTVEGPPEVFVSPVVFLVLIVSQ